MPTFQSVNLDPTVSSLFTGTVAAATTTTTNDDNDDDGEAGLQLEAGRKRRYVVDEDYDGTTTTTTTTTTTATTKDQQHYDPFTTSSSHNKTSVVVRVASGGGGCQKKMIAGIATPRSMITRAPQDLVEVFLHNKEKLYPESNNSSGVSDGSNDSSSNNNNTPSSRKRGRPDNTSRRPSSSSSSSDGDNDDNESLHNYRQQPHHQQQQQRQKRLKSELLGEMEGLRKQVAHKMIGRTRTGKLLLAKSLSSSQQQQQHQKQNFKEKKILSSCCHSNVLVPGASFTPLEFWERQSHQALDNNKTNTALNVTDRVVRTGCEELDRLLTFPPEALDFTTMTTKMLFEPHQHSYYSSRQLGLPPGYVLQITSSGSSPSLISSSSSSGSAAGGASGGGDGRTITAVKGKTQLALQIAVHAIKDSIRTSKIPRQEEQEHQQQQQQLCQYGNNENPVALAATNRRLIKVRYCYSAGGHTGHCLATRFLDLLGGEKYRRQRRRNSSSKKPCDVLPPQGGDQIEFQPIYHLSQLSATLSTIEHEWVQTLVPPGTRTTNTEDLSRSSTMTTFINDVNQPPSLLVVDGLYSIPPDQDETQFFKIERWLKRIARQYSISVVVVGGGGGATGNFNMVDRMDGTKTSDCHLNLTVDNNESPSSSSAAAATKVQLMRHPVKLVTDKDSVLIEHDKATGILLLSSSSSSSHETES